MNDQFIVDNKVKIPERCKSTIGKFPDIKVGQSFLVPGKTSMQLSGHLTYYKLRRGYKITTRTIKSDTGEIEGTRVWRIQ